MSHSMREALNLSAEENDRCPLDGFEFSVKHEEGSLLQREDRLGDSGEQLRWEQVPSTQEELCGLLGKGH